MKDVQSTTDNRGIAIQRVGIKDAYLPFLIKTKAGGYQQVGAKISFAVALPMEYKGTHMSRFLEILNPWGQKPVAEPELAEILKEALEKLQAEFPNDWRQRIEEVSAYVAGSGKTYKNFLAVIRNWARRDEKENMPAGESSFDTDEFFELAKRRTYGDG